MTNAITLRGLVALLNGFPALAGVNLVVKEGEIVQLSGPNGSGKTTLLRSCAGLVNLSGEQAEVLGSNLLARGPEATLARRRLRDRVGWLGHADSLYEDLTVREQLAFRAQLTGAKKRAAAQQCAAALGRVALEARLAEVPIARLSAGQRRRVSLAQLVIARPQLWLLDEPHSGLDARGCEMLDGLLAEAAKSGATVMFAAHIQREIAGMRQVELAGGRAI